MSTKKSEQMYLQKNTGKMEWYTPGKIIDLARETMGSIDLDPASCEIANAIVQAKKYYTASENGLSRTWYGNVFLNPPYASKIIRLFVDRLIFSLVDIDQAIVLVSAATETSHFQQLLDKCDAVCFPKGRIKFWSEDSTSKSPLQGHAIFYFGFWSDKFANNFSPLGQCLIPR